MDDAERVVQVLVSPVLKAGFPPQATGEPEGISVLTELQNRGVKDIFIACVDGLTGFPEAIEAVFPQAVQLVSGSHEVASSSGSGMNSDS